MSSKDEDDDEEIMRRTRICEDGEVPGKRDSKPLNPCWFIPEAFIISNEDCDKKFAETQTCERGRIFVPLGVTKICITYETEMTGWSFTEGTNGYCGLADECCEWHPKETSNEKSCSQNRTLVNWFPVQAGTNCIEISTEEQKTTGMEVIKGKVKSYLNKIICLLNIQWT